MIKDFQECLFNNFALIGPVTLPDNSTDLNNCESLNNSKEIILSSKCPLYTFPKTSAKTNYS